jgi:hypothetical protein
LNKAVLMPALSPESLRNPLSSSYGDSQFLYHLLLVLELF